MNDYCSNLVATGTAPGCGLAGSDFFSFLDRVQHRRGRRRRLHAARRRRKIAKLRVAPPDHFGERFLGAQRYALLPFDFLLLIGEPVHPSHLDPALFRPIFVSAPELGPEFRSFRVLTACGGKKSRIFAWKTGGKAGREH